MEMRGAVWEWLSEIETENTSKVFLEECARSRTLFIRKIIIHPNAFSCSSRLQRTTAERQTILLRKSSFCPSHTLISVCKSNQIFPHFHSSLEHSPVNSIILSKKCN
jgi:hypothetical protein